MTMSEAASAGQDPTPKWKVVFGTKMQDLNKKGNGSGKYLNIAVTQEGRASGQKIQLGRPNNIYVHRGSYLVPELKLRLQTWLGMGHTSTHPGQAKFDGSTEHDPYFRSVLAMLDEAMKIEEVKNNEELRELIGVTRRTIQAKFPELSFWSKLKGDKRTY